MLAAAGTWGVLCNLRDCGIWGIVPAEAGLTFDLVASFTRTAGAALGQNPEYGNLVEGSDGNFYGTTRLGGYGYGALFKVSASGTYTLPHSFADSPMDGGYPVGGLVQGSDGFFCGTANGGGGQR